MTALSPIPTPRNLNYWWTFGAMLSLCLVVQIVTGMVLAMHYVPHIDHAFDSVQRIRRDVSFGWLLQPMHAVGASMFFLAVYVHMFRGLYYGSYKAPREVLWILGCIIYAADGGDRLPWLHLGVGPDELLGRHRHHQHSGRDTVCRREHSSLDQGRGGDRPADAQSLLLAALSAAVRDRRRGRRCTSGRCTKWGRTTQPGVEVKSKADTVPFTPHATIKDLFATSLFLILFAVFVFFMADSLGDPANYIPANPLQTPPEIVPEWYLLPFYAILRAFDFNIWPINSKLAGVIAMFASIGVLFVLPWLDTSNVRSMRYRPIARQFFFIFVVVCIALGWCGGQNPGRILFKPAEYSATLELGRGRARFPAAHSPRRARANSRPWRRTSAPAWRASAGMAMVTRENATDAQIMAVTGGARQSRSVSAGDIEELGSRHPRGQGRDRRRARRSSSPTPPGAVRFHGHALSRKR